MAICTPRQRAFLLLARRTPDAARLLERHPNGAALLAAEDVDVIVDELQRELRARFPALLTQMPGLRCDARYWWQRRQFAAYQRLRRCRVAPRCWALLAGLPEAGHRLARRMLGCTLVATGARFVVDRAVEVAGGVPPEGLAARWHAAYDGCCPQGRRRTLDLLGLALLTELSMKLPPTTRAPLTQILPWLRDGSNFGLATSEADRTFATRLVTRVLSEVQEQLLTEATSP